MSATAKRATAKPKLRYVPGSYRAWRKRLESRALKEDPANPRTWVLDDVWRAACTEVTEREWERERAMKPFNPRR